MSLADVWDDTGPGNYLKPGWHEVTVTDFETFQYNSGSQGVTFTVKDAAEVQSKASFVLLPQCWWKLASFAKACGITREQAAKYDPERESSHRMLLRKRLKVHVVLSDGKYSEVDDWAGIKESVSETSSNPRVTQPQQPEPAPPTGNEIPF